MTFTPPNPEATFRYVTLEQLKVHASTQITGQMLERLEFNAYRDDLFDRLVIQLKTSVLGHPFFIQHQLSEERPDGWFQYLKRAHAPRWFLRRWPVVHKLHERTVSFPVTAVFPEAPAVPNMGPVRFPVLAPQVSFKYPTDS